MFNQSRGSVFSYRSLVAVVLLLTLSPLQAFAAAPSAGDILRQQPQPPAVVVPETPPAPLPVPAEKEKETGPKILVKGFRIKGAHLIPEAELAAQLQGAIGKELSFRQLRATTSILIAYYAHKGYLARVILPEQDVRDGIVTLQVVEGKRGNLRINSIGSRIDSARVERLIDQRLGKGDAMNIADLGEALSILNEQPGILSNSALVPGKGQGDIDVVVTALAKPLFGAALGVNNYGMKATGTLQESGSVTLSNPTGHFDVATLTANVSDGTTYSRLDYSLAAGDSGLRLGADASNLRYRLTQSSFSSLQATGRADTVGLTASYPLARRSAFNLSLTGSYDDKKLIDDTIAGETGNHHVTVSNLGLSGYTLGNPDSLLGSGMTSFGADLGFGNSDQLNAAALAADSTTRQEQGHFNKLAYNAGYLLPITSKWSLNATLRGQFADKNLNSTERFYLGGPDAVRAYPTGEATGDEGWLFSLNATDNVSDSLAAHVFLDSGSIVLNRNLWNNWNAGSPGVPNRYMLSGAGVGLDWRMSPHMLVTASIATPLGNNPGSTNGFNSDGSKVATRGWLGLNAQF